MAVFYSVPKGIWLLQNFPPENSCVTSPSFSNFAIQVKLRSCSSRAAHFASNPFIRIKKIIIKNHLFNSERQGFEPWVPFGTTLFESAPINHSGISPPYSFFRIMSSSWRMHGFSKNSIVHYKDRLLKQEWPHKGVRVVEQTLWNPAQGNGATIIPQE